MAAVHVGTSGWSYPSWRPVLYPGVPQARWLDRYAAEFDTVELNGSFYHWPPEASFAGWRDRLPAGFRFTVKAPRGLTHARRLQSPGAWVQRIERAWTTLGERSGVLLLQLPPALQRDDALLDSFLSGLPAGVPAAVEFRHESWLAETVFDLLEKRATAYVVMSGAGLPCVLRRTTGFVYVRLHGPDAEHLYAGSYSDADLAWWAARIGEWRAGGADVYAYFNNDGNAHAVRDARRLRDLTR